MNAFRLLPLLALLACGSGDPPSPGSPTTEAVPAAQGQVASGTFELTVTGDIRDQFSGVAHFFTAIDDETGQLGFVLVMNEDLDADDGRTLMISSSGGRPATGEHPFVDVESLGEDEEAEDLPPGLFGAQLYAPGEYMLYPRGGNLRITESTDTRLVGSFSFPAVGIRFTGHPPPPTGAVQVAGRFEAQYVAAPNRF